MTEATVLARGASQSPDPAARQSERPGVAPTAKGLSRRKAGGVFACAVVCTLLTLTSLVPARAANAPKEWVSYVGCTGSADERTLELDASFFLYEEFLQPGRERDAQLRAAAVQHVYYLRGYLASQKKAGGSFELAWSVDEPDVKITAVTSEGYPLDLTIDASYDPNVKVVHPYMKAALAAGRAVRGGRALRVSYKVRWRVVVCAGNPDEIKRVRFGLPFDPYLIYWAVKPDERRPRHYGDYKGVVNPCVVDSFLIYPDPYYLWYFWRLNEAGTDDRKEKFLCAELLRPERDFFYFTAELLPGSAARRRDQVFRVNLLPAARPLRVSAVFGLLDAKRLTLGFDELISFVASRRRVRLDALIRRISESYPINSRNDSGAEYFRDYVEGLPALLAPGSGTVEADAALGVLRLRGTLRRSSRRVEVSLFYGPTDLLTTKDVKHWPPLLDFLERGDILAYTGHAGLGENVKVANLLKEMKLTDRQLGERLSRAPAYQLLAYFSCYSYSYFGDDVRRLRRDAQPGSATDVLYTAADYGSGDGGLGILNYVDRHLARARGFRPGELADSRYLSADEFLVVKSYE